MKHLFLMLIVVSFGFAGDKDRVGNPAPVLLQTLSVESQNATGFSNMLRSEAGEIGSGNPAALDDISSLSVGMNYSVQSEADYFANIKISRAKPWLPSSVGIVYPLKNWRFGLSYHQKYSTYTDYGKIQVGTIINPDSGEVVDVWNESIVHSTSALIAYTLGNVFTNTDRLSIGAQFFWNIWNETQTMVRGIETNASGFNWKAGLIYRMDEHFGLGLTYQSKLQIEGDIEGLVSVISVTNELILPSKLLFGFELVADDRFRFAGTASAYFWSDFYEKYENSLDLSFNVIYSLSEPAKLSMGFYKRGRRYNDNSYFSASLESIAFLSAGVKATFGHFNARVEILDSHLFSNEHQRFTVAKIGLDYILNH